MITEQDLADCRRAANLMGRAATIMWWSALSAWWSALSAWCASAAMGVALILIILITLTKWPLQWGIIWVIVSSCIFYTVCVVLGAVSDNFFHKSKKLMPDERWESLRRE